MQVEKIDDTCAQECRAPPPLILPPRTDRLPFIREAFRLEWLTIGWMTVEAVVAIAAGVTAGSLVLIAFGLDSVIELASAGVLMWRLTVELRHGQKFSERAERIASRIGGALLFVLAALDVFDGLQAQLAANRSQFYRALPEGPFYGYNRPGVKASEAVIANWWRQGMMGGAKAHYDGIVAFSQTDFTDDLKKIAVPVLVMHSEDDQIFPYVAAGPLSAKLLKNGTLKTYKDFPHGMPTTQADTINADLLAFLKA